MAERLLYTPSTQRTRAEIASVGGRVVHELTPSLLIADVPDAVALDTCTADRPDDLDEMSVRVADAWLARGNKRTAASESPPEPWDAPGRQPPR